MSEVRFSLPDDPAAALGVTPEAVGETVRLAAALKMYELGRLSAGAAAALAGFLCPYSFRDSPNTRSMRSV